MSLNWQAILLTLCFCILNTVFLSAHAQLTRQQTDSANQELQRFQLEQQQRLEYERLEREKNRPRTRLDNTRPNNKQGSQKGYCIEIKSLVIEGADLLPKKFQRQIAEKYENKCLYGTDIEGVLADVTAYYIERGYIASRAYIKKQDASLGILYISVIEGVVEGIQLEDGKKNNSISLGSAFPFIENEVFNLRDIEQGLDQINRLQSNNATVGIKPGSKAGDSIVVIQNKPSRRIRGNVSYDTHGSASTGENQLSIGGGY